MAQSHSPSTYQPVDSSNNQSDLRKEKKGAVSTPLTVLVSTAARGGMMYYPQVITALWVALFAYLGVLVRVTLTFLSSIPQDTLLPKVGSSFFLPNIVGSFLMGVLGSLVETFKPWVHIHKGLSSGFCGSCTTFATWQLVAAAQILNGHWLDSLIQSLITFCTSYMALSAGRHLGEKINAKLSSLQTTDASQSQIPLTGLNGGAKHDEERQNGLPSASSLADPCMEANRQLPRQSIMPGSPEDRYVPSTKSFLSLVCALLCATLAIWLAIFLDTELYRCQWWVAVAFAPAGALTRYFLSLYNPRYPDFPVFTLVANIAGTVLNMVILALDNHFLGQAALSIEARAETVSRLAPDSARHSFNFWMRHGLSTGCMGSLSTVSTFVNEIWKLAKKGGGLAYRYGAASLLLAQLLCLMLGGFWILAGNELSL